MKGAKLAKINVPANAEVGLVAATRGETRGEGKEEKYSDSDASFHMSHTQAGMAAYKKAPAGTTIEVADGTTLPVAGYYDEARGEGFHCVYAMTFVEPAVHS